MSASPKAKAGASAKPGAALDFQEHLAKLDELGLVVRIDRAINKDTELHPLVRWQFQGGLSNDKRRAFVFTNVVDGSGKRYDMPVVVGALASSPEIYALGMGVPVDQVGEVWLNAIRNPIEPVTVLSAP
jgi:4-hydroxy-3-polyprenylbenzoate decarboxylase